MRKLFFKQDFTLYGHIFQLLALLIFLPSFSQTPTPSIVSVSESRIVGYGIPEAIFHYRVLVLPPAPAAPAPAAPAPAAPAPAAPAPYTIPSTGYIDIPVALTTGTYVEIWQDVSGVSSQRILGTVVTDAAAIPLIVSATNSSEAMRIAQGTRQRIADDLLLKSTKSTFKTFIFSTNFTIPVARFNINKPPSETGISSDEKGTISLFTSIGAGLGIYAGRITRTRDSKGIIVDEEFSNTWGLNFGILYQASTGDDQRNVFAPTISISLLDIQFGIGYDYGKIPSTQERYFFTLAYSIPLYKLTKTGYRVWLKADKNPIEVIQL